MKIKKNLFTIIFIALIGLISYEVYYYINYMNNQEEPIEKKEEKKDLSKYLTDVTTPYNMDNLDIIYYDENDTYYYLIDGLLNSEVENIVNNKIKETINELKIKYPNKEVVGEIVSNFENTLSLVFSISDKGAYQEFKKNDKHSLKWFDNYQSEVKDTLNFDLTTGNLLTISDVVDDKLSIKTHLQSVLYEEIYRDVGFVCGDICTTNPKPDYSKVEDDVLSLMNRYNKDKYNFIFTPENIVLYFDNVYIYNPELADDGEKCQSNDDNYYYSPHYGCINLNNYDTSYRVSINLLDIVDNLIIYNRFKTSNTIYTKPSTEMSLKFKVPDTNNYYKLVETMEESDNQLIDYTMYFESIGNYPNTLYDKVYNDLVKESNALKSRDFNIYNLSGSTYFIGNYHYFQFDLYHYNLPKDVYLKHKRDIYIDKHSRYIPLEMSYDYNLGYDYLKEYQDNKAYYYYIYDSNGNFLNTKDILSDTFDFSTVIPESWLVNTTIDKLLNNALILVNEDFNFPNNLVIYDSGINGNDQLVLKYKGNKVVLADDYDEYFEMIKKIYK